MEERAIAPRPVGPPAPSEQPRPAPLSDPVPALAEPGARDLNPASVYLAGKPSAVGRRGLQRSLNRAAEVFTGGLTKDALLVNWAEVRYQHVAALRSLLIDRGTASATINHILSAIRGTIKEAWRLGLIDAETQARVTDVRNVKSSVLPSGRHVDIGEVTALFRACGDTLVGARDAALLALLYGGGVRRSEAVALQLADYDAGKLAVRQGKGRKERVVFLPSGGREAVEHWIARRGAWPGALLCPVPKNGDLQERALTAQAVLLRLRFLAKRANVPSFSPHDLRRSFVGMLLDNGADISSVQQLAGHASVTTTQKYDRRGDEAKRRTAELLHVPYSTPAVADTNLAQKPTESSPNERSDSPGPPEISSVREPD